MPICSYMDLAFVVVASPAHLANTRMVAIDGGSGSGKTMFASRLERALQQADTSVGVIHTDDLYNGWQHPSAFAPRLNDWVVQPMLNGRRGRYRRYDWATRKFQPEWVDVGQPEVLIIEGVTTASAAWRPLLSYSIMMIAHETVGFQRAVRRDGETIRGPLREFVAHTTAHFDTDETERHVDLCVDGSPQQPHDPQQEFVAVTG